MASLDTARLQAAFPGRPDLVVGIQEAADSPARVALFNNISSFVCEQLGADEPALKRRKVDNALNDHGQWTDGHGGLPARQAATTAAGTAAGAAAEPVLLEIKDISLSMPQRKKFDLCLTQNFLYARAANTTGPAPGIAYAWTDIEYVFCVPVPDKTQRQFSYLLFPRGQALAALSKTPAADARPEPLVLTVPATAPKPGALAGPEAAAAAAVADSYSALLHWALEKPLRAAGLGHAGPPIVGTDARVFHSMARQAYRPGEQAVHVRAFRGSKDGYLFFLPTGILWAFKKPLLFLPLDRITAVSYTNVLQRTFNMVVEVDVDDGRQEEVEFGMLDQEDYGGIDETYVRRHGLQDRSMAERRKARLELAENGRGAPPGDGDGDEIENGLAGAEDGETGEAPLSVAEREQQLQDEEDEMEDDYDPGSEDDSDGSGSGDDDEEADDDDDDEEEAEEDEEDEADMDLRDGNEAEE